MNEGTGPDQAADPRCPTAPRPLTALGVAAASAVLAALTIVARNGAQPDAAALTLNIAVGVLGCALAPLLLWRPLTGALGLVALAALSPAVTPPATFAALHVAQRYRLPIAVAVAAAGVAAHAAQGLWQPSGGLSYGWWLVLITTGYGAMVGWGALVRVNRALVVSLRERARRAEAEQGRRVAEARMAERTRIAREMHDVLAHRLSLLATYAGALEYRPDSPPQRLAQAAGVVRTGVHQALEELREVILVLRDEDAGEGVGDARRSPRLADIPALVEESRCAGAGVRLRDETADADSLPAALGRTAYRVVQEGLTNARKHAPGRPVEVELTGRPGEALVITVTNPLGGAEAPVEGAMDGPADGPAKGPAKRAAHGSRSEHGAGGGRRPEHSGAHGTPAKSGDTVGLQAREVEPEPEFGGTAGAATGRVRARGALSPEPPTAGATATSSGTGLVGLTERVHLAGGRLDHGGSDGRFRLHARLPWPA